MSTVHARLEPHGAAITLKPDTPVVCGLQFGYLWLLLVPLRVVVFIVVQMSSALNLRTPGRDFPLPKSLTKLLLPNNDILSLPHVVSTCFRQHSSCSNSSPPLFTPSFFTPSLRLFHHPVPSSVPVNGLIRFSLDCPFMHSVLPP